MAASAWRQRLEPRAGTRPVYSIPWLRQASSWVIVAPGSRSPDLTRPLRRSAAEKKRQRVRPEGSP